MGGHYAPTCRVAVIEAGSLPYTFHLGWRGKLKSIQPMMRRLEWDRGEGGRMRRGGLRLDGWMVKGGAINYPDGLLFGDFRNETDLCSLKTDCPLKEEGGGGGWREAAPLQFA